jgi:hypothetical protein
MGYNEADANPPHPTFNENKIVGIACLEVNLDIAFFINNPESLVEEKRRKP